MHNHPIHAAAAAEPPVRAVPNLDARAKVQALIALGMGDLLPHIAAGAEHIGHTAVMRGDDDHTADYWFRIHEAADMAIMEADAAADAVRYVAIGGGHDRRMVGVPLREFR